MTSWRLPFVSRERLEEAQQRIQELELKLYQLEDRTWLNAFGFQIHGSLAKDALPAVEPEPELTPEEISEQEFQADRDREKARLVSIARTNPSQLGSALERSMAKNTHRRAIAAHPQAVVRPEVRNLFENAKTEAMKQ